MFKQLSFLLLFIFPVLVFADPLIAPTVTPPVGPVSVDDPMSWVKLLFEMIAGGRWPEAGAVFLIIAVGLIRLFGPKLHAYLPDNVIWDKPLTFLFETKPGGWVLNFLTAVAGGLGSAVMVGSPLTWGLVKPILSVALTGAGIWTLVTDIVEWWKKKKLPSTDAAAAAGAAAAEKPPADGLDR